MSHDPDPDPGAAADPRPRPQYGEYATPQEVARARGIPLGRGADENVERLAEPIPPAPSKAAKKSTATDPALRHSAPPTGQPVLARHPGQRSALITVLLLVFGIWNTVTSIPSFLDLGSSLSQGLAAAGYGTVAFGAVAHVIGVGLLVFSFLVLIAAVGLSLRRIRMGRSSIWVPLVAAAVWLLGLVIGMIVVVANTPGITALIQNHS
ncbi:hypothetical protein BH10ACT6_BH10ACT6_09660 [soil metagenome]